MAVCEEQGRPRSPTAGRIHAWLLEKVIEAEVEQVEGLTKSVAACEQKLSELFGHARERPRSGAKQS